MPKFGGPSLEQKDAKFPISAPIEQPNSEENEQETTEPAAQIENKFIAQLEEPMQNILDQMREEIESGKYGLIIGDDASGRIPTFIFREILNQVAQENQQPKPETIYFAGTRISDLMSAKELKDKMDKMASIIQQHTNLMGENQRTLLTTDTIATGKTLKPLMDVLKELNIDFDVATIGVTDDTYLRENLKQKYHCRVFVGEEGVPLVYGHTQLAGVIKESGDLHAQTWLKYHEKLEEKVSASKRMEVQDEIIAGRKNAKLLAQKLVAWLHRKNPKD